jgi:hypothetical protein
VAEDLLVLAIDRDLQLVRDRQQTGYAVLGAELAELAVAQRVAVRGREIWVTDPEAQLPDTGRQDRLRARLAGLVAAGDFSAPLDWALAGLAFECGIATGRYPGRADRDSYRVLRDTARGARGKGSTAAPAEATIRAAIRAVRFAGNDGAGG